MLGEKLPVESSAVSFERLEHNGIMRTVSALYESNARTQETTYGIDHSQDCVYVNAIVDVARTDCSSKELQ